MFAKRACQQSMMITSKTMDEDIKDLFKMFILFPAIVVGLWREGGDDRELVWWMAGSILIGAMISWLINFSGL